MKKIIYSLVIMIAASSLFTACIEQIEPKGVENLRDAKAEYLKNVGQLRLAEAEVQKAQATYWQALAAVEQANAAYRDAETEGQKLLNEMQALLNEAQEMDNEVKAMENEAKAAEIAAQIEKIRADAEVAAVEAQKALAQANEDLRVALAKIAADQLKLTDAEAAAVSGAIAKYEGALAQYLSAVSALTDAEKAVWNHEYDMATWGMGGYYEYMIEYYTEQAEIYKEMAENVPEDADVEAWQAELKKYQDSLEEYKYNRYQVTKDSVDFMVNVYHDGVKAYEDAFEAWLEDSPFKNAAEIEAFDPAKAPKLEDYTKPADTLNLPAFDVNMTSDALYVYKKFFSLLVSYAQENPYSAMSPKTDFLSEEINGGISTISILAGQDFKDFILGAEDATDLTCKYDKDEPALAAQYGLKGALSTIKRDLVLIESEPDSTIEKNYKEAKAQWEADRDTLLKGRDAYQPVVDAKADLEAAKEALKAAKKEVGSGNSAMVKAIEDLVAGWNQCNGASPLSKIDSITLYNAFVAFAIAREQYLDYAPGAADSNYFRYGYNTTNGYDSVAFKSLTFSGFQAKTGFDKGLYARYIGGTDATKDYGYSMGWNNQAFAYVVMQLFGTQMRNMIITSPVTVFPTDKAGIADKINNGTKYNAFYGLYRLAVVDDKYVIQMADGSEYIPSAITDAEKAVADAEAAVTAALAQYEKVYKRYWGDSETLPAKAEDEYNVKIYTYETFTQPYPAVIFNGKTILFNNNLGAILGSVDAKEGHYGQTPAKEYQDDWDNAGDIYPSVTFGLNDGTEAGMTDFAKYLYWEAKYYGLSNFEAYQKAIEEIAAWVEECEAAFAAQVEKAAADGQKKYDKDAAAFEKKVAAYKELTGKEKKGAKVYATIDVPTNYSVPQIEDGEWVMGGKMAEWADEFLPEYPAKIAEWKKAADKYNDQIYHLTTLLETLDAAYIAAVKVYNTETTAASFKEYVREYGKARADYYDDCMEAYYVALDEVEYYTKQLAQYEAGYDATQLAYEDALRNLAMAEQAVADALAELKIAEAEYNKVMAEYCPED